MAAHASSLLNAASYRLPKKIYSDVPDMGMINEFPDSFIYSSGSCFCTFHKPTHKCYWWLKKDMIRVRGVLVEVLELNRCHRRTMTLPTKSRRFIIRPFVIRCLRLHRTFTVRGNIC